MYIVEKNYSRKYNLEMIMSIKEEIHGLTDEILTNLSRVVCN